MMQRNILLVLVLLLGMNLHAQSFQIGHTTITFMDSSRNNRNIATEIYYPADMAGDNVALSSTNTDKFPVLSFGHGFVMTWDAYKNIWEAVVPAGFIIAFPKTEGSISPSHSELGKDLAFVITALTALGQNNTSLFYQRVDSMNTVMGHSMGGGAAFLAAQFSPAVKTLATLAPAETNPSAVQAAAGLSIPALILAGGNDCITPPLTNQLPMYNALPGSCKTYLHITGGSHCQMANNNLLCSFGEATCTPAPSITRAEQHATINQYLIPWLKYTLKGDCLAGAQFDSLMAIDQAITFQKTCLLCNTIGIQEHQASTNVAVFPNPFHQTIFVQCGPSASKVVTIDLYSIAGKKLLSNTFSAVKAQATLELAWKENLPAGIYLLEVTTDGERRVQRIIKQ